MVGGHERPAPPALAHAPRYHHRVRDLGHAEGCSGDVHDDALLAHLAMGQGDRDRLLAGHQVALIEVHPVGRELLPTGQLAPTACGLGLYRGDLERLVVFRVVACCSDTGVQAELPEHGGRLFEEQPAVGVEDRPSAGGQVAADQLGDDRRLAHAGRGREADAVPPGGHRGLHSVHTGHLVRPEVHFPALLICFIAMQNLSPAALAGLSGRPMAQANHAAANERDG